MNIRPEQKLQAAVYAAIDAPIKSYGTEVIQRPGWYQVINKTLNEPSENEVMLSLLEGKEIDRAIEETFDLYRAHNLSFKWCIGPMSSPDLLGQTLARRVSTNWVFRGMSIDSDVVFARQTSITTEIVNADNFAEYLDVTLAGWNQQAFGERIIEKYRRALHHPQYRSFLARKNGEAIGSAATIIREGYGYLVGAVVLEKFRGCGAYRALTQVRLSDLKGMGIKFAVTQAREATSAPILEKLGFETVYKAQIYKFDA